MSAISVMLQCLASEIEKLLTDNEQLATTGKGLVERRGEHSS